MKLTVNGAEREVPDGLTVTELVHRIANGAGDGRGVAVAVEAQVVPRSEWDARRLSEGERIEVVGAIQGG
jgi:sulfur carrier protein